MFNIFKMYFKIVQTCTHAPVVCLVIFFSWKSPKLPPPLFFNPSLSSQKTQHSNPYPEPCKPDPGNSIQQTQWVLESKTQYYWNDQIRYSVTSARVWNYWHERAPFQRSASGRSTAGNDIVATIFISLLPFFSSSFTTFSHRRSARITTLI